MISAVTGVGLLTAIGLVVSYFYKRYLASIEIAILAKTRADRLKPIDDEQKKVNSEVQSVEQEISNYEHDYGVKLIHTTDDSNGSNGSSEH